MAASTNQLHQELKHKFVLDKLRKLGVTHSQEGDPITELDYESLKYELVLASFKEMDVQSESNKWF
ncbi:hypothetical protein HPT25_23615 [Bacillus sp. BRMEA1]|uniref:hypothetical protein n=1 Tax=Neobacillus endophyticus TaxID=2738405 RepID=UPI001563751D|nr:hypothetical protein [Neobacillus endophyticus]NRD80314.1 hypothetical protein [Neobacillus endophyticus]